MKVYEKIYVAGHQGLVGSALVRKLQEQKYSNIIVRSFHELDLRDQQAVDHFFSSEQPVYVLLAAAKVGGIKANMDYPAAFIYDNMMINANVIHAAYTYGVKKLIFLGSSCIYPRVCPQPIKEEYLLRSELEKSNEPYAVAKIAGIKLCQAYNRQYGTNFISCMPPNLYGPYDNFNLETSHVLPALLAKIYIAKKENMPEAVVWGTGQQYREFLYVDDCADAILFLMREYHENEIINIGTGNEITIAELAYLIKEIVGYTGKLVFDARRPGGTPRKMLDGSKLHNLGWRASVPLEDGIRRTLSWCLNNRIFEKTVIKRDCFNAAMRNAMN